MPAYANELWCHFENTIKNSSKEFEFNYIISIALAASYATKCKCLVNAFRGSGALTSKEVECALKAASLMGVTNVWYPFTEMAGNRLGEKACKANSNEVSELDHKVTKEFTGENHRLFELCELSASIIGKCDMCVKYHCDQLKANHGVTEMQLCTVGRICASIAGIVMALAAEN